MTRGLLYNVEIYLNRIIRFSLERIFTLGCSKEKSVKLVGADY